MAARFTLAMYAMKTQEHTPVLQRMKQEWMKISLHFLWRILLERHVCTFYFFLIPREEKPSVIDRKYLETVGDTHIRKKFYCLIICFETSLGMF